jgi:hypothetical protein
MEKNNHVDGIKLYEYAGCEWFAADSLRQARECRQVEFDGLDPADEGDADNWRELDADDLDRYMFTDDEVGKSTDPSAGEFKRPFRQELENRVRRGDAMPSFFASTEY